MANALKIKFFGMIAEGLGCQQYLLNDFPGGSVKDLKRQLTAEFPQLEQFTFSIAVNQKLVGEEARVEPFDELAVLPPFAGG